MSTKRIVFTKPWKEIGIGELAELIAGLGVDGIELPVRPGYQVEPGNVADELPRAVQEFRARGVEIVTIACEPDLSIVQACAAAGVSLIRTMVRIDMKAGYRESVERSQRSCEKLTPLLLECGVRIGVQNHCDYFVGSAVGLMDFVAPLDPEAVCAVLDLAHCSLDGEPVDLAIDICRDRIGLVNLKSAYRRRITGANAEEAAWRIDWTTARDSFYSWRFAVETLASRGYDGDFCLPAEYTAADGSSFLEGNGVLPHLQYDIAYLDSLLARPTGR